jgi:Protein of unknown function (DUF3237)
MAEYSEKGLTLRWDEPELMATEEQPRSPFIVVAVRPPHPSNVVTALYVVGGGVARVARGYRLRAALGPKDEEFFGIDFPPQTYGVRATFIPIFSRSGRQADPRRGGFLPTPLPWAPPQPATVRATGADLSRVERVSPSHPARFGFEPEFLFRVTAPVAYDTDPVGETPDGLRMKFLLQRGGYVQGPALTGEIAPVGGDWMRIRPDGVGIAEIRALIKPVGGGIILTEYSGIVDFGCDGYQLLAAGGAPKRAPLRFAPRYLTKDSSLSWMNRLQCFGVGEVNLERYLVEYDLYALRSKRGENQRLASAR